MADTLSGITRNSAGAVLGGVTVEVFDTVSNLLLGTAVSNGAGAYTVTLSAPSTACFAVAYKAGTPDVAGTTLNNLVSVSSDAAETTAFLARTTGLNATHINAYKALINGLVADGVFAKLDVLHIYATQDSTTALLNLVSTSFNGTLNGAPNFSADNGFLGVDASATVYIATGFTAATAGGHYVLNSAHISAWSLTNAVSGASGGCIIGGDKGDATSLADILVRYSDGNAYFRINDDGTAPGTANADSRGHFISNRTGASASQGYVNGALFASPNKTSVALPDSEVTVLALSRAGVSFGGGYRMAAASIGGGLSGTDVTNFYNRLRTYMTAVGVP